MADDNDGILHAIKNAEILAFPSAENGGKRKPPRGPGKPGGGREPPPPEPPSGSEAPDPRISIKSTPKTFAAEMTKAFEALSQEPPLLFTFGPSIVRPETQRFKDSKGAVTYAHVLRIISEPNLLSALALRTLWYRYDKQGNHWVCMLPPAKIIGSMLSEGRQATLPVISFLTSAPALLADGRIVNKLGYDCESGIYQCWELLEFDPVQDIISREEADSALSDLSFLISEFKFKTDVDRAVALSWFMTFMLRPSLDLAPLHLFTAPTAGSGKTMLVDLGNIIAMGEKAPAILAGRDPVEIEKVINGALLAAARVA